MSDPQPAHKRILLKLSGEALMGDDAFGINRATIVRMVGEVAEVVNMGVQVAVVIGGGNIFRGVAGGSVGMDRATADYMGMLATVMNSLAVQSMLEAMDVPTRVQSAIKMDNVAEPFIRRVAMRHLELGRVVIFAAGTGNPFFSTDTTAALRASEISADIQLDDSGKLAAIAFRARACAMGQASAGGCAGSGLRGSAFTRPALLRTNFCASRASQPNQPTTTPKQHTPVNLYCLFPHPPSYTFMMSHQNISNDGVWLWKRGEV